MRTFNKYRIIITCCSFLSIFISCSDFLEEDPKGQMTNLEAFTEKTDLEGAIHALMYKVKMANSANGQTAPVLRGDDMTSIISKTQYTDWDQFINNDGNGTLIGTAGSWSTIWAVVKAANFVINGVANTPDVTEEEINQAIAQGRFWRGYFYFWMVRCWGPLPVVTTNNIDLNIGTSSEEEIYKFILEDLTFAEKYLPANFTKEPWFLNGVNTIATKAAAQATLSQVYMTMAGWPLNKGGEYYKMAADKAKEIIDASNNGTYYYKLYDEFWKVYSQQYTKNNQEIILGVYYTRDFGTGDHTQAARGNGEIPEESGGYSNMRAEIKFWKEYPMGPRKKAVFGDVYYHNQDEKVVPWFYSNVTNCNNPYYIIFPCRTDGAEYNQEESYSAQADGWSSKTSSLIRLAQVYLWYAEAVGRSGQGDKAKAIALLNEVRRRADGKWNDVSYNHYDVSMSYEELAEAAYQEHGWEIAGYYRGNVATRYHDQRRMNRLKDHFEYRMQNPEIEVTEQWLLENPDKKEMVTVPVFLKERVELSGSWNDDRMYAPYPAVDVSLCPNLHR